MARALIPGDQVRVPFGGNGSQLAKVEKVKAGRVALRRYRERSDKWNKRLEWWDADTLFGAITDLQAKMTRRHGGA